MTYLRSPRAFGLGLLPHVASLTMALALTLTATHALASEEPLETARPDVDMEDMTPTESHDDLLVTGGVGAFRDGSQAGGTLGVLVLRQQGALGYGATFEYGGAVFDYTVITAAPVVGLFVDSPTWLRLGIAATGGLHVYKGVGSGLLSSDPGASGTTGFLGARALAGAELGGKARFHIGLQLALDNDLARDSKTYTYQQTGLFSDASSTETATHTVGTFRYGAMLAFGAAFDL